MDTSIPADEMPRKRVKISEDESGEQYTNGALFATSTTSAHVSEGGKSRTSVSSAQQEKEICCGITHYVTPDLAGFSGILKQRYTDFLVNEILPGGEVLHLRNLKPDTRKGQPSDDASKQEGKAAPNQATEESKDTAQGDAEAPPTAAEAPSAVAEAVAEGQSLLKSIVGEATANAISFLYSRVLEAPEKKPREFRDVKTEPLADKQDRTRLHQTLRKQFRGCLESVTNDDNSITIHKTTGSNPRAAANGRGPGRRRQGKLGWDELGGEFLHFTLYKENKDTMEVIYFIASQMKLAAKHFQFAGTKDRRAVTVQRVSVFRVEPGRIHSIGRQLRGSKVGDFKHERAGLELGQLDGNEFLITLRDCHFTGEESCATFWDKIKLAESCLQKSTAAFQERGFINYYGLQRFGSFATTTATVGLKLLQGNFEAAVNHILEFSPVALALAQAEDQSAEFTEEKPPDDQMVSSDDRARASVINAFRTSPSTFESASISKLPRKFSAESIILKHLSHRNKQTNQQNRSTDFLGAIQGIPRNLRLMYVHAYQSLVWNAVASKRWTLYGDRVVEGDLVIIAEHKSTGADAVGRANDEESDVDEQGEIIIKPAPAAGDSGDDARESGDPFVRARALTAEEAASGAYSIFDVVLPLPGFDVVYPPNALKDYYVEFMGSEQGGALDPFDMRRSWKDFSLSGGYRKVLGRPRDGVGFEVKGYENELEQMVETDLESLLKSEKEGGEAMTDAKKGALEQKQKIAVILKFQLGTSQYATVALRELMRSEGVRMYQPDFSSGR